MRIGIGLLLSVLVALATALAPRLGVAQSDRPTGTRVRVPLTPVMQAVEAAPATGLRRSMEPVPSQPSPGPARSTAPAPSKSLPDSIPSTTPPATSPATAPHDFDVSPHDDCEQCQPCGPLGFGHIRPSWPPRWWPRAEQFQRSTWTSRPYSLGVFAGGLVGNELANNLVEQEPSLVTGLRAGWDVSSFWGLEARLGFADPKLHDIPTGHDFDEGNFVNWDVDVLYYPWGDTRLRPYFLLGLGMVKYDFTDTTGRAYSDDVVSLPLGAGVKYRCTPSLAARFDLVDTIGIAGDTVGTLNNLTFTFGLEYRFGGQRATYYPWDTDGSW